MLSAKLARLGQPSNARWPFVGRRRQPTASFAAAEVLLLWSSMATLAPAAAAAELRVETALSFTGRMCAATRWAETQRADAMFADPLAYKLAGAEGRAAPMGEWIMVPRTKYGDDLLQQRYQTKGCRQLVLLGAGMDTRAYRMDGMEELRVFEVDQQTTFNVKEPLLQGETVKVARRTVVRSEFTDRGRWAEDLVKAGFDATIPTTWLLEGLVMYLSLKDTKDLMHRIGGLSASGSVVFHDAVSATYLRAGIRVGGADFIGGSDDYGKLWAEHAGFAQSYAWDFSAAIHVDRKSKRLICDKSVPEATARACKGRNVVLFVEVEKL